MKKVLAMTVLVVVLTSCIHKNEPINSAPVAPAITQNK